MKKMAKRPTASDAFSGAFASSLGSLEEEEEDDDDDEDGEAKQAAAATVPTSAGRPTGQKPVPTLSAHAPQNQQFVSKSECFSPSSPVRTIPVAVAVHCYCCLTVRSQFGLTIR